ncbi:hypothetical protein VTN77DRAFT_7754 [Rasamsonia byssochlamydoides]|uniref:uncharacterized protein n=1 Tax=Rasamsonia byssochlamydoides TaxID=89139 RepID=UPI0037429289
MTASWQSHDCQACRSSTVHLGSIIAEMVRQLRQKTSGTVGKGMSRCDGVLSVHPTIQVGRSRDGITTRPVNLGRMGRASTQAGSQTGQPRRTNQRPCSDFAGRLDRAGSGLPTSDAWESGRARRSLPVARLGNDWRRRGARKLSPNQFVRAPNKSRRLSDQASIPNPQSFGAYIRRQQTLCTTRDEY